MAEEIALDIKINAAAAATSVKDLKAGIKGLKDELNKVEAGSADFRKLTKAINDTEGKLGDLNDSFNTLTGSGVERTTKSFNLLKEGFANFDIGKIGAAFKGLGTAMKAVPIFLLVEGITYLITNFKELSEGTGVLAKVLKPIGDLFTWITDKIYAFTDAIGLTNKALEDQQEQIKTAAEETQKALEAQTAEYDRQMKVAKAAGQSTIEIEIAKQQAIIETNKKIVEQELALIRSSKSVTKEQLDLVNASLNNIKNAAAEIKVIELTDKKEKEARYKTHLDELDKKDKVLLEERKKREKELDDYRREIQKEWEKEQDKIKERFLESKAFEDQTDEDYAEKGFERFTKDKDEKKKAKDDEQSRDLARFNEQFNAFNAVTQSQAQLVNFLFDLKRSKMQKGSAEELRLAKRQFQINKALAIQSSIITGIQGVVNALSANSVVPEPYGTVLKVATAAAVGIAATINTAKIASQQFNPDGGGGGGVAADTGGMGAGGAAPTIATPTNTVTKIADDGSVKAPQPTVKAVVVETDITQSQKRVNTVEEAAKFG